MNGANHAQGQDYIANLAAAGRYHFTVEEMGKALGISRNAAALALNRLSKQALVASPARGFCAHLQLAGVQEAWKPAPLTSSFLH